MLTQKVAQKYDIFKKKSYGNKKNNKKINFTPFSSKIKIRFFLFQNFVIIYKNGHFKMSFFSDKASLIKSNFNTFNTGLLFFIYNKYF